MKNQNEVSEKKLKNEKLSSLLEKYVAEELISKDIALDLEQKIQTILEEAVRQRKPS